MRRRRYVVLLSVLDVGLAPMLLIVIGIALFQYYTSDKLALAAAGEAAPAQIARELGRPAKRSGGAV